MESKREPRSSKINKHVQEVTLICRLCTLECENMKNIFEDENQDILEMLTNCTDIVYKRGDILPEQICTKCIKELKHLYEFRLKIQQSEKKLKKYFARKLKDLQELGPDAELNKISKESYLCSICGIQVAHLSTYIVHKRYHSGAKPFQCPNCTKKFVSSSARAVHIRKRKCLGDEDNNESYSFLCYICGKSFSSDYALQTHITLHNGKTQHTCNMCDKSFGRIDHLQTHMRRHTGERPFQCTYCEKSFTQKSTLKTHLAIHSGKLYSCDVCEKRFPRSSHLKRHQLIHSEEKKLQCSFCDKKFHLKRNLVSHENTHRGLKPFSCQTCGSSFTLKNSLIKHMVVHTGDKPYLCNICGRSYTQSARLTQHMKTVHTLNKTNKQSEEISNVQEKPLEKFIIRDAEILDEPIIENNLLDSTVYEIIINNSENFLATPLMILTSNMTEEILAAESIQYA